MTTLRTRIDELSRVLEGHQADEQEALAVGRLSRFATNLRGHAARLAILAEAAEELQQSRASIAPPRRLDELLTKIGQSLGEAEEDGVAAGRGDEPPVAELAAEIVREASSNIDGAWIRLKDDYAPPSVDDELLGLAAEQDAKLANRFELAAMQLFILRQKFRPAHGDIGAWLRAVDQVRSVADEVAARAPSQIVIEFLREATSPNGAPIDYLSSPEVQDWLAEGDRSNHYRVVSRPARR